jgi:hypothetical protein
MPGCISFRCGRGRRIGPAVVVVAALAVAGVTAGPARAAASRAPGSAVLSAVSCPRSSWCMAVGTDHSDNSWHALARVWNGRSWRVLADPPGHGLDTVSCSAPSFCIAFGQQNGRLSAAERWDGHTWRKMAEPEKPASGPSCGSRSWCMVARYLDQSVETWNGRRWQDTELCGSPGCIVAVACASASFCAAIGYQLNDFNDAYITGVFWNGDNWTENDPPGNDYGGALNAVSCTGNMCMAVGPSGDDLSPSLADEWDSATQTWLNVSPATATLGPDISCGSAMNCMTINGPLGNAWWNGSTWQYAQFAPGGYGWLNAVSCGGGDCLAVGYRYVSGTMQPLAERWNGTAWKITATPR